MATDPGAIWGIAMIARFAIPLFLFCATAAMLRAAPDFSHQIVPILRENCGKCHTGDERKGGFSMNTRAELLAGSENGKVVVPGKAADSLLIEAVTTADEDLRMPPKGALRRQGAEWALSQKPC